MNLIMKKTSRKSLFSSLMLSLAFAGTPDAHAGGAVPDIVSGGSVVSAALSVGVATASPQAAQVLLQLGAGASVTIVAMGTVFDRSTTVAVQHEPSGEVTILEVPNQQVQKHKLKVNDRLTVQPFPGGVELRPIDGMEGVAVLDGRGKALMQTERRPQRVFNR